MPQNEPLSRISLNARAYWREDGIPALVVGLGYTIVVCPMLGLFLIELNTSPDSDWAWLPVTVLVFWFPGAFFFGVWLANNYEEIVERIKVRITYPRTGYVAPPSYWNERLPRKKTPPFDAWIQRQPVRRRLFHGALACVYFIFITSHARSHPGWVDAVARWKWPWLCAAIALIILPSLARNYVRKLRVSRLYWTQILGMPVYMFVLIWLTAKELLFGFILLTFLPVLFGDYVSKLRTLKLRRIEVIGALVYLSLVFLLMKRDPGWGTFIVLLTPGIYLILKGALRLVRYLYLHRGTQAS